MKHISNLRHIIYRSHILSYAIAALLVLGTISSVCAKAPATAKIVFTSTQDGGNQIYIMNPDGSNQINLSRNDVWDTEPVWSPDGAQILFVSDRDGLSDLYIMDADGRGVRKVFRDNEYRTDPTWSPDGKQIAYAAGRTGREGVNIIITDPSGNKRRNLTQVGRGAWARSPAWSPDGKSIAYFFAILPKMMPGEKIEATKFWADNVICVIKVEGGNEGEPLEETRGMASNPVWLPETFFPVSPSADKHPTLWGAVKNQE